MRFKFKKGDKIECVSSGGQALTVGKHYVALTDVDTNREGELVLIEKNDRGQEIAYYVNRFRVPRTDIVRIDISGTIQNRGNGVVTIDTKHGAVVVPDAFLPEDPDLIKLRELLGLYYDTFAPSTAANVRRGGYTDRLKKILPQFKELLNESR